MNKLVLKRQQSFFQQSTGYRERIRGGRFSPKAAGAMHLRITVKACLFLGPNRKIAKSLSSDATDAEAAHHGETGAVNDRKVLIPKLLANAPRGIQVCCATISRRAMPSGISSQNRLRRALRFDGESGSATMIDQYVVRCNEGFAAKERCFRGRLSTSDESAAAYQMNVSSKKLISLARLSYDARHGPRPASPSYSAPHWRRRKPQDRTTATGQR